MALLFPITQFFDSNGDPLASGKLYSYQAGTTTPQSTYTDDTGTTPNANPLILDSAGRGVAWLLSSPNYKLVLKDSSDATIWTLDNVTGLGTTLDSFTELQANLDTNNYQIVTTANNYDITLAPHGTGQSNIYSAYFPDGAIEDDSGNELLKFTTTASAVNELTITNQATGSNPSISATGGDTNIGVDFQAKGTGVYNFKSTASQETNIRLYEDTDNGSNYATITVPASLANNNGKLVLPAYSLTLPSADGASNTILTTNGSGTASWSSNIIVPGTFDVTGAATCNASLSVKNGATGPGQVLLFEDSDNGTNKITITPPSSLAADYTLTLPSALSTDTTYTTTGDVLATSAENSGTLSFLPRSGKVLAKKSVNSAASLSTSAISSFSGVCIEIYFVVNPITDNVNVTVTLNTNGTAWNPTGWACDYFNGTSWTRNSTDWMTAVGVDSTSGVIGVIRYYQDNNKSLNGQSSWFDNAGAQNNALISCYDLDGAGTGGIFNGVTIAASSGNISATVVVVGRYGSVGTDEDFAL